MITVFEIIEDVPVSYSLLFFFLLVCLFLFRFFDLFVFVLFYSIKILLSKEEMRQGQLIPFLFQNHNYCHPVEGGLSADGLFTPILRSTKLFISLSLNYWWAHILY